MTKPFANLDGSVLIWAMQPESKPSNRSEPLSGFIAPYRPLITAKAPYFFVGSLVSLALLFCWARPQWNVVATASIVGLLFLFFASRVPPADRFLIGIIVLFPGLFVADHIKQDLPIYLLIFFAVVSGLHLLFMKIGTVRNKQ